MKRSGRNGGPRWEVRALLSSLLQRLDAAGVEFLDIGGTGSCRLGLPGWRKSEERRARRARQEMRVFRLLDEAGSIAVRHDAMPDLHAWELRFAKEGYECINHRVGDQGILHVFIRGPRPAHIDRAMEETADDIEGLLNR